jgi:hypothetical protein
MAAALDDGYMPLMHPFFQKGIISYACLPALCSSSLMAINVSQDERQAADSYEV